MAIVYGRSLAGAGGRRRKRRGAACCDDCGEGMARQLDAGVAALVDAADLGDLFRSGTGRRRALRNVGQAHRSGALAGLGDIDMSSFVVSQSSIDAEAAAFDGRLNAWLLDFAQAAARLDPAFVQQVDDFVGRWRSMKDSFYFFQTSRLKDLVNAEAEFNRFRDQFLRMGQTTEIAPATVTADGKTVRADKIPPGTSWFDQVSTIAKWGGVIVGGAALVKISSDLGLFKRLGRSIGGRGNE